MQSPRKQLRITKLQLTHIKKMNNKMMLRDNNNNSNNNNRCKSSKINKNNIRSSNNKSHLTKETKLSPIKTILKTLSQELAIRYKTSRNNLSRIIASTQNENLGMEINLEKLDSICLVEDTVNNLKSKKLNLKIRISKEQGRN